MADQNIQGISTYQTYLMVEENSVWNLVVDITSFPDLISPNDRIDITTLSDSMRKYIQGIKDTSEQIYGCNYTPANYKRVNALSKLGPMHYALWFGATTDNADVDTPTGQYGKFDWTGEISPGINGGGVNEAVGMTITCTPNTVINPTFPE